jgi:integrase
MVGCSDVRERLHDYLEDDLWGPVRAEYDRHLVGCSPCADWVGDYRETIRLAQTAFPEEGAVPEDLIEVTLDRALRRPTCCTAAEATALLDASSGVLRLFLEVALATGLRVEELLLLRFSDVDRAAREVRVPTDGRRVALNDRALWALLAATPKEPDPSAPVFRNPFGTAVGRAHLARSLRTTLKVADARLGASKRKRVRLDTMRNTFAALLLRNGVGVGAVAALLGTPPGQVARRFRHVLATDDSRRAVEALGRMLDAPHRAREGGAS